MLYDFHTHTFFSDGCLSPIELIRRAVVNGYKAICIADHASGANLEQVITSVKKDCDAANKYWDIIAIPGVELTHLPAKSIPEYAAMAKKLGAKIVVVHGETPVEPVEPGTNLAAVSCKDVDILAHPGFLKPEEASLAKENGVYIEVTKRQGHSLTNGHVVKVGREAGVNFLINTDTHSPGDLLTAQFALTVARGAGLTEEEVEIALKVNPVELLKRIGLKNS